MQEPAPAETQTPVQSSASNRRTRLYVVVGILTSIVVIIVVLLPGYLAQKQINAKIAEILAKDETLTKRIATFHGDATYADCIAAANKAVDERGKLEMDLKGFKATVKSPVRDQVLAFMALEDDICHTQASFFQATASFNAADEYASGISLSDWYTYSGWYTAWSSAVKSRDKAADTLIGWCDTYKEKYDEILKSEKELSEALSGKGIPFSTLFDTGKADMLDS